MRTPAGTPERRAELACLLVVAQAQLLQSTSKMAECNRGGLLEGGHIAATAPNAVWRPLPAPALVVAGASAGAFLAEL